MEKIRYEANNTEGKKIRFGKVDLGIDPLIDVRDMPFPTRRVLHWLPQFRAAENDVPPPVRILISQEILVAVNNHVSQTLETEMGGFLLGNRYQDPGSGLEFVIIDQYVQAQFTESTPVSLSFTVDAWMHLKEDLSGKYTGKALVGWYHSHPRMDVFLSEFDLQIHEERFKEPWGIALVIEPEKRLGGFFAWRDGKMNPRSPVEFYEYLSGEMVMTKESGSPWVNYVCYNDATGQYFDPPRLQNGAAPVLELHPDPFAPKVLKTPPGSLKLRLPLGIQRFAYLVPAVLVLLTAAIAYYLVEVRPNKPTSTVIQPGPAASPRKVATAILRTVDREKSKFRWIMGSRSVREKVGKRSFRVREVSELTDRAEIFLTFNNVPDGGREAKEFLDQNVKVKVNDSPAEANYTPQVDNLTLRLRVSTPQLLSLMKASVNQQPSNPLNIKMEFFTKDDPAKPLEMNATINLQDIPKALKGATINITTDQIPPLPEESEPPSGKAQGTSHQPVAPLVPPRGTSIGAGSGQDSNVVVSTPVPFSRETVPPAPPPVDAPLPIRPSRFAQPSVSGGKSENNSAGQNKTPTMVKDGSEKPPEKQSSGPGTNDRRDNANKTKEDNKTKDRRDNANKTKENPNTKDQKKDGNGKGLGGLLRKIFKRSN